jgi:hypothetical protein
LGDNRTAEGKAYTDPAHNAVYKIYDQRSDYGGGLGLVAKVQPTASGDPLITYHRGTVGEIVDKANVLTHLGTPTEIVGVTRHGEVITKQPYAKAPATPAERSANVAGLRQSLEAGPDRGGFGAQPVEIASVSRHGQWMVNVSGQKYLVTDFHKGNVYKNNFGEPRPIDAVVGRVTPEDASHYSALQVEGQNLGPTSPARPF